MMKFTSSSITMGVAFAISMSIVFYQSLGISGIAIGMVFGYSMAMAFAQDEKEEEENDEDE